MGWIGSGYANWTHGQLCLKVSFGRAELLRARRTETRKAIVRAKLLGQNPGSGKRRLNSANFCTRGREIASDGK